MDPLPPTWLTQCLMLALLLRRAAGRWRLKLVRLVQWKIILLVFVALLLVRPSGDKHQLALLFRADWQLHQLQL